MAEDPRVNPYAPPREPSPQEQVRRDPRDREAAYASERRSVLWLILLAVVTINLYPMLWFVRRRPFLDSLDSDVKLGAIAWGPTIAWGTTIVLALASDVPGTRQITKLLVTVVYAFVSFRVAGILQHDFARAGLRDPRHHFLGICTLLFGVFYLQHKINQVADLPRAVR